MHRFAKSLRLSLALLAIPLMAGATGATTDIVLDEAWEGSPGGVWNYGVGYAETPYAGQSYTASQEGRLAGVQLSVGRNLGTIDRLEIRIVKDPEQFPTPVVLGRVFVEPHEIPHNALWSNLFYVDLSAEKIDVHPWDKFGILMRAVTPGNQLPTTQNYWALGSCVQRDFRCVEDYPFGSIVYTPKGSSTLHTRYDGDYLFRTFVRQSTGTPVKPRIYQQPFDQRLWVGEKQTLSVFAAGTEPFAYQWFKDGEPIPNANQRKFTLVAAAAGDRGMYSVEVRNAVGAVVSGEAKVEVNEGPVFDMPQRRWTPLGESITLYANALGKGVLRYQWKHAGEVIRNATSMGLTISSPTFADAGQYTVLVTDDLATVESPSTELIVRDDSARQEWAANVPNGHSSLTPDAARGQIYFGEYEGEDAAVLDGRTGQLKARWYRSRTRTSALPLLGDHLFFNNDYVSMRDPATGTLQQSFLIFPSISYQVTPYLDQSAAVSPDGMLYSSSYIHGIIGVDWKGPGKVWTFRTRNIYNSGVVLRPETGLLYAASDTNFYCLRTDGTQAWRYSAPPESFQYANCTPALGFDGLVYFARGRTIYALDGATGMKVWSRETEEANYYGGVVDEQGVLFWTCGGDLLALNGATGELKWKRAREGYEIYHSTHPMALDDGSVVVGAGGLLRAYDRADGSLRWDFLTAEYGLRDELTLAPDGRILAMTYSGKLFALKGQVKLAQSPWPKRYGNLNNTSTPNPYAILESDLAIEATLAPVRPRLGEEAELTLRVSNSGGLATEQIVLTDQLVAGQTFLSAQTSQGTWSQAAGTITFALGRLNSGNQATAKVRVRVTGPGILKNEASVTGNTADPSPFNNRWSISQLIDVPAGIETSRLALPVRDLAVNSSDGRIYLAPDTSDASLKNLLLVLSPQSGRFEVPFPLRDPYLGSGNPPGRLAVKGDWLYVQRAKYEFYIDVYDLRTREVLGEISLWPATKIQDMAILSDPRMLVVATDLGIRTFRNNQPIHSVYAYPSMIEVNGNDTALFQLTPSKCRLFRYSLDRGRLTLGPYKSVPCGFEDFQWAARRLYHASGSIYDEGLNLVARATGFGETPKVLADGNSLFVLSKFGSAPTLWKLSVRDATTLLERRSIDLPALTGVPTRLVRYGATGVACLTSSGELVVIQTDPLPTVSISDARYPEAFAKTKRVYVTLSQPSATPVSVNVTFVDGEANAGTDYAPTSTYVPFEPGRTSRALLITLVDDATPEPEESFSLVLSDPVGAVLAKDVGTVTIDDDDGPALTGLAATAAGTGTEAESAVRIGQIWAQEGVMRLSFDAEPGDTYGLQRSRSIDPAEWMDVGLELSADGADAMFELPTSASEDGHAFFRVTRVTRSSNTGN